MPHRGGGQNHGLVSCPHHDSRLPDHERAHSRGTGTAPSPSAIRVEGNRYSALTDLLLTDGDPLGDIRVL
jgi:hypothetical protein